MKHIGFDLTEKSWSYIITIIVILKVLWICFQLVISYVYRTSLVICNKLNLNVWVAWSLAENMRVRMNMKWTFCCTIFILRNQNLLKSWEKILFHRFMAWKHIIARKNCRFHALFPRPPKLGQCSNPSLFADYYTQ